MYIPRPHRRRRRPTTGRGGRGLPFQSDDMISFRQPTRHKCYQRRDELNHSSTQRNTPTKSGLFHDNCFAEAHAFEPYEIVDAFTGATIGFVCVCVCVICHPQTGHICTHRVASTCKFHCDCRIHAMGIWLCFLMAHVFGYTICMRHSVCGRPWLRNCVRIFSSAGRAVGGTQQRDQH